MKFHFLLAPMAFYDLTFLALPRKKIEKLKFVPILQQSWTFTLGGRHVWQCKSFFQFHLSNFCLFFLYISSLLPSPYLLLISFHLSLAILLSLFLANSQQRVNNPVVCCKPQIFCRLQPPSANICSKPNCWNWNQG